VISRTYRRTGADPPFGDPGRPHGVAMEGWFWRFTHPERGDVAVVLAGVNRDGAGRAWGTIGLAAHPGGFEASALVEEARADDDGAVAIGAEDEGTLLRGDASSLRVALGAASLDVVLEEPDRWPRRRAFGALGAAQAIPGLSQYWYPFLLRARVRGTMVAGGRAVSLDGAIAYAEKNWSNGGFPETWWWGQAQAFDTDPSACVAFAGGRAGIGPLRLTATSLVVSAGGSLHRLVRPLQPLHVEVGDHGWRLRGITPTGVSVSVEGHANGTPPHLLPVPEPRARRHREGAAAQHLAGELRVVLRRRGRTVFDGTSVLAGLERGAA
jgi:tocopherol cyclase